MSPSNIYRGIGRLRFVGDVHTFVCALGVAGWVDTDVGGTIGTVTYRIWLVVATGGAGQWVGVRKHGETEEPLIQGINQVTFLTDVDTSGHCDLYRNAVNDVNYNFLGYFETA